jgi:hypothetical protein
LFQNRSLPNPVGVWFLAARTGKRYVETVTCRAAQTTSDRRDASTAAPALRRGGQQGVRTRILIIDDDRRSPIRLHRLEPDGASPPARAGKAKRNGHAQLSSVNGSLDEATLALPDAEAQRLDLAGRGAVLDMDAALVRDVLARVQELLAQAEPDGADDGEPEESANGRTGIVIDLPTQTVWRSGRAVRVTPTEFRLLVALVRRRGAVVSREDLRRDVWPDGTEVQSRVIDSHIARLRRKLENDPKQPRHILTALAAGYRFLA